MAVAAARVAGSGIVAFEKWVLGFLVGKIFRDKSLHRMYDLYASVCMCCTVFWDVK